MKYRSHTDDVFQWLTMFHAHIVSSTELTPYANPGS